MLSQRGNLLTFEHELRNCPSKRLSQFITHPPSPGVSDQGRAGDVPRPEAQPTPSRLLFLTGLVPRTASNLGPLLHSAQGTVPLTSRDPGQSRWKDPVFFRQQQEAGALPRSLGLLRFRSIRGSGQARMRAGVGSQWAICLRGHGRPMLRSEHLTKSSQPPPGCHT